MYYDVVEVRPLTHLHFAVRFKDGLTGEVRFEPSHLTGVFEALKNPEIFASVSCAEGFVTWPGELDLAPDAMYDEIKVNGVWILM
jgi:hypothetical protein